MSDTIECTSITEKEQEFPLENVEDGHQTDVLHNAQQLDSNC